MLGRKRKSMLAVVIGEKAITFQQRHSTPKEVAASQAASLVLPPAFTWDKPGDLAQKIKALLRENDIAERTAIVGLPSRWVLVKPMQLPPTDARSAAGIMRLTIEREYQADAKDWVFDYAGKTSTKDKGAVLLAATPRTRLAQMLKVMAEAGLNVEIVTSTIIELAGVPGDSPSGVALYLSPDGIELGVNSPRGPVLIERLTSTLAQPAAVTAEVKRAVGAAGFTIDSLNGISIYPSSDEKPAALRSIVEQLGLKPDTEFGDVGEPDWRGMVPNVLASVACDGPAGVTGPRINFQKSRLAEAPDRWLTRQRAGLLAAGIALAGILLFLVGDWYTQKTHIEDLRETLAAMKPEIAVARANVDRMKLANGWYDTRPAMLDCARAITLAFPTGGQAWTTSLSIRDDMSPRDEITGTLVGKAQSEKIVLELLDRLRTTKRISEVNLLYRRPAERNSKTEAFALTFTYTGRE